MVLLIGEVSSGILSNANNNIDTPTLQGPDLGGLLMLLAIYNVNYAQDPWHIFVIHNML